MNADGRLLIVGEAEVALGWAERLAAQREVTVFSPAAQNPAVDAVSAAFFRRDQRSRTRLTGRPFDPADHYV